MDGDVIVLALDTSCSTTSVALCEGARVLAAVDVPPPQKAGELLPGLFERVCADAGAKLQDVRGLAVGLGPGSFTGLRVGLAAAKGLAYALRVPLAGVSSLAALAHAAGVPVLAVTEARRGEVFAQQFPGDGVVHVWPATSLAQYLAEHPSLRAVGPGVTANRAVLPVTAEDAIPQAVSIASLCAPQLEGAAFDTAALFALAPQYVTQSEAEKALAAGRVGKLPK